jgi:hypothetical protein
MTSQPFTRIREMDIDIDFASATNPGNTLCGSATDTPTVRIPTGVPDARPAASAAGLREVMMWLP